MKELPPVQAGPSHAAAESVAGLSPKKLPREDTSQLRNKLLKMIVENESRRRTPTSTSKS